MALFFSGSNEMAAHHNRQTAVSEIGSSMQGTWHGVEKLLWFNT
jgi:hypothetical protein